MSSESTSTVSSSELAAAAELRLQQQQGPSPSEMQFSGPEHELRQKFRRLIDPGILRPNASQQAVTSLKLLLKISENILSDPDNTKFHQFKPTNSVIKRDLIDPKGTVEYARELGFYPEVRDFQPYYSFNPRRIHQLRIGADMLREALTLVSEREERAAQAKKNEKAVAEAAAEKIRLAFEDDRKRKQLNDALEKERREARIASAARHAEMQAAAAAREENEENEDEAHEIMPGSGNVLGAQSKKNTD